MRTLPSLSGMEHITSKEFGECMDAILDRIAAEDIAMIIDHESNSYVICPASWFELPVAKHVECMIKNAVRYVVTVDDTDLNETLDMVREFLPALSAECISQLLEIVKSKHENTDNKKWINMKLILGAALPTAEKGGNKENHDLLYR